jgi:hypothetical protein
MAAGPIIVTAAFEPVDFAWFDGLRRAHYPPERNLVPAHLTLFQHLPPGLGDELDRRLKAETRAVPPPWAKVAGVMKLDRGVALRVESTDLEEVREHIADAFAALLIPQDAAPWLPHVTIQNKADPSAAAKLHAELARQFAPRTVKIAGLATWRYLGGPWQPIARYAFSRSGRSRRN